MVVARLWLLRGTVVARPWLPRATAPQRLRRRKPRLSAALAAAWHGRSLAVTLVPSAV